MRHSLPLFLCLSGSLSILNATESAAAVAGRVVSVSGIALIRSEENPSSRGQIIKQGDNVSESDVINTDSAASLKLLMVDKSVIDIGPSTLFKISEYKNKPKARNIDMSMPYGRVRALVSKSGAATQNQIKLRTRSAVMGVRGTEFIARSELIPTQPAPGAAPPPGRTEIIVVEGRVDVRTPAAPNRQPISMAAGSRLVTAAEPPTRGLASAPPPRMEQLSRAELRTVASQAVVADRTFVQAVTVEPSHTNASSSTRAPASSGSGSGTASGTSSDTGTSGTNTSSASPADVGAGSGSTTLDLIATTTSTAIAAAPEINTKELSFTGSTRPQIFTPPVVNDQNTGKARLKVIFSY